MKAGFHRAAPLLPEIIALHGKWLAGKDALIFESERRSWPEFCQRINQVANGLHQLGVKPGQRVAVLMSNSIATVEALFGIMAAGVVSVPINLSVTDETALGMIKDAGAVVLITTADQQSRLADALATDIMEDRIQCISVNLTGRNVTEENWFDFATCFYPQSKAKPQVEIKPDDALNIIYSSGTTGLPKGILHTHQGRRDWTYDLAIALRYHSGARTLITVGMYSNITWVAMLATMLAGGTLVIHPKFDARQFLQTVQQEKITHTAMVPIQYQRVMEVLYKEDFDVSSMQAMMCCGSPLHEALKKSIFQHFPCGVIELYGLTEGIITTLDPEDAEGRWKSVGRPLQGTDICIIDEADKPVPNGQVGEIVSRGRIVMPGYFNWPEATKEATWVDEFGQPWLRSGDLGYLDEQGYLYIVDRKKDMILSGGQNVYPQDIEAVLIKHPQINDVAVIGVKSRRWGETPVAIVVPKNGKGPEAQEIMAWCNSRVGKQQRIIDVLLVDALPRNPNGKILKRELRKTYSEKEYD